MLDLIESSSLFPGGRPTPWNRFSCCDCTATQSGLRQVCELIQPAFTMFPGRRPTRAVEPWSKDHRKQLHHFNSDPETDKLAGPSPTANEGFRV